MINLDSLIERKKEILYSSIDHEVVMLSPDMKEYLGLNLTASKIWELIERPVRIRQIINSLLEQFEIDETSCKEQTIEFINVLIKNNLVKIH